MTTEGHRTEFISTTNPERSVRVTRGGGHSPISGITLQLAIGKAGQKAQATAALTHSQVRELALVLTECADEMEPRIADALERIAADSDRAATLAEERDIRERHITAGRAADLAEFAAIERQHDQTQTDAVDLEGVPSI